MCYRRDAFPRDRLHQDSDKMKDAEDSDSITWQIGSSWSFGARLSFAGISRMDRLTTDEPPKDRHKADLGSGRMNSSDLNVKRKTVIS